MSDPDRMAHGYQPDFDIDAAVGHQGELFTWRVVDALADGSSQTKNDAVALRTGRLYLEWQCWQRGAWRPSGIADTPADVWVEVIGGGMLIAVPSADVRAIARAHWRTPDDANPSCTRGSHPTRGVLITIPQFIQEVRTLIRARERGDNHA
jgi:hypothetical protein